MFITTDMMTYANENQPHESIGFTDKRQNE